MRHNRYRHFQTSTSSYKEWAVDLQKAGYAINKSYAGKLIQLIEELKLDK